jgi:hypothetical protein
MATEDATLDRGAIRALTELLGDDRDALEDVVGTFLEEAPRRLADLRDGLARRDAAAAGRAAHTLKANGLTFGAQDLAAVCLRIETAARASDLADADGLLREAEAEWARVRPALANLAAASGA